MSALSSGWLRLSNYWRRRLELIFPITAIGALAGFAAASIPGALLGGLLGQIIDRRLRLASWSALLERFQRPLIADDPYVLFVMLGRMAKCEGRVLDAHIQQARAEMRRLGFDEPSRMRAIEAFARGKTGTDSLRSPLQRQRGNADSLLRACWRMAWADGRISRPERELIMLWGKWLGVPAAEQEAISANYAPKAATQPLASGGYQGALRIIGVSDDCDPAQIKRAYRLLLSKHHPDKLAGRGASAEQVREATEKTRELHQAYRVIRQRRGF